MNMTSNKLLIIKYIIKKNIFLCFCYGNLFTLFVIYQTISTLPLTVGAMQKWLICKTKEHGGLVLTLPPSYLNYFSFQTLYTTNFQKKLVRPCKKFYLTVLARWPMPPSSLSSSLNHSPDLWLVMDNKVSILKINGYL